MDIFRRIYALLLDKARQSDSEAHARALRDVAEAVKVAMRDAGYDLDAVDNAARKVVTRTLRDRY